jgi:hypothetical protein
MSSALTEALVDWDTDTAVAGEAEVRSQIWGLLCGLYPNAKPSERRQEQRYPYPRLIEFTPVAADGRTPIAPPIVAAGKQISERGMSFFHPHPIPHRLVIASLESNVGGRVGFLLDLTWCRFTKPGWYESGGRFLRTAALPTATPFQS